MVCFSTEYTLIYKLLIPCCYDIVGGIRASVLRLFLLYILPAYFVPLLKNERAKKAILKLVKASALSLQWNVTHDDVSKIRR